jgi:uncharacterized membrane protein
MTVQERTALPLAQRRGVSVAWLPTRLVLSGLFLLGLGLRLWDLGVRSFWTDELSAVGTSALSFWDLVQALTVESNMTLYYWALHFWLRIVGLDASEWLIRLPSAIVGSLVIPVVYVLGRRLHSNAAGLAAAGLLAINGFHVLMSQEARAYAALSLFTVLAYIALDQAVQSGRWQHWAIHGALNALAFYCHFYTAFTMLAQGLFVLLLRDRRAVKGLVVSGAVSVAAGLQLIPFFLHHAGGSKLSHLLPPKFEDARNFLIDFSGGDAMAKMPIQSYGVLAIVALLAIYGFTRGGAAARSRWYRAAMLLTWFFLPLSLSLGISLARPIFNDRYLFAILPAVPLLAGMGLARLRPVLAVGLFGVLAALSIVIQAGPYEVRRNEEWRDAVKYTVDQAQPGDGYIFISKWNQNGFEYYAGWRWGTNPAAPYADIYEPFDWRVAYEVVGKYRGLIGPTRDLEAFADTHNRIWLVLSHEFDSVADGDMSEPARDWLTRHGYGATQKQFKGVRILRYDRR